jgi:hypothetical protein
MIAIIEIKYNFMSFFFLMFLPGSFHYIWSPFKHSKMHGVLGGSVTKERNYHTYFTDLNKVVIG